MTNSKRLILLLTVCVVALVASIWDPVDAQSKGRAASNEWPTYGHDAGGQRFSPLTQITPANVSRLEVAWVYHMRPTPTTRRTARAFFSASANEPLMRPTPITASLPILNFAAIFARYPTSDRRRLSRNRAFSDSSPIVTRR